MIGAPAPSVLESAMDRLIHRYRLPIPQVELVTGPDGEYRLDYAYPPIRFAFEVDGYVWHFSPEHARRDHARRNQLITAGWTLLVYTWRDVLGTPDHLADEILTNHRSRAA
jgi:very-short-patch-repair endonuclease